MINRRRRKGSLLSISPGTVVESNIILHLCRRGSDTEYNPTTPDAFKVDNDLKFQPSTASQIFEKTDEKRHKIDLLITKFGNCCGKVPEMQRESSSNFISKFLRYFIPGRRFTRIQVTSTRTESLVCRTSWSLSYALWAFETFVRFIIGGIEWKRMEFRQIHPQQNEKSNGSGKLNFACSMMPFKTNYFHCCTKFLSISLFSRLIVIS